MPINPSIAMSYRAPDIQPQNMLADYAAIQQIRSGQQAEQLNALRMQEAQATMQRNNALRQLDPAAEDYENQLIRIDPKLGIQFRKDRATADAQTATKKKTQLEIEDKQFDLKRKRLESSIKDFANFNTVGEVLGHIKRQLDAGEIDQAQAQQFESMVPKSDTDLPAFQIAMLRKTLNVKDQLDMSKQTTKDTDRGGYIERQILDWQGKPVGEPVKLQKTATINERTAQGQLNLAKQKFDFERANPTMSIQEDPSGLLAVNTRTGVATPVVYGPKGIQVAPAAAPGAGMPGPRLPAQTTQAIPGMTSVLDRTAAPAAMPMPAVDGARAPGTPVRGTKDAPAKFNDTDMQLSGLAGSLKEFKDEVAKNKATSAKWLPTGADTARMQARYTSLLMGVKDLYTLGALAGPDMSIIESQLTNPASWTGKFTSKKGFEEQIQVIEDMLKRTAGNLENTYNRPPKATKKALEALGSQLPGASANDPLGLGIGGGR